MKRLILGVISVVVFVVIAIYTLYITTPSNPNPIIRLPSNNVNLDSPKDEWFHPITVSLNDIETTGFFVAVPGHSPQFVIQNQVWVKKTKGN